MDIDNCGEAEGERDDGDPSGKSPMFAPTGFRGINAINGRAEILLGPDPYAEPQQGAIVFAPPGAMLRGTKDRVPLTREGWRVARWGPNDQGHVLIDQGRPFAMACVDLGEVVEEIARLCPEHLSWVASIVERQARLLLGRLRRRTSYVCTEQQVASLCEELDRLAQEADNAFDRVREGQRDYVKGWWAQPNAFGELITHGYRAVCPELVVAQEEMRRDIAQLASTSDPLFVAHIAGLDD